MAMVWKWLPFSLLSIACLLCGVPSAQSVQTEFPPNGDIEYEHSIITIPLVLAGETTPAEVLKLDAFMRLVRHRPVRNGLGYRQFEFFIDAWELYGYSRVLNANITFKLADTVKPKSLGVSLQKTTDYPAMIVYDAIYDIYINDVKLVDKQPGVAFATGVMEIPPRNITVAFHKPFSYPEARANDPQLAARLDAAGADLPAFEFAAGTCEDMTQITAAQFNAGAAQAAAYRTRTFGQAASKSRAKGGDVQGRAKGAGAKNKPRVR